MIIRNFLWLLLTQSSRGFRLVAVVYAARLLGTAEYGRFAYVLGLLSILALFADSGLSELLTRDVARDRERTREYFATSFWMKILLVLFTAGVILTIAPFLPKTETLRPLLYLSILLMVFDNLRDLLVGYLRGLQRMELETVIIAVMNFTILAGVFLILPQAATASRFLVIYILGSGTALFLSIAFSRKMFAGIVRNFRRALVSEILKNSWPLAAVIGLGTIYGLDIVMLGWWSTTEQIGLYSAGQRAMQILAIFPTLVATAIMPSISAAVHNQAAADEKILSKKAMMVILTFTGIAVTGGIIFSEPIIRVLYGAGYEQAAASFAILLSSSLLTFPGILAYHRILAHNKQQQIVKFAVVATAASVVLNILLIPSLGIIGAATATTVAQAVNSALLWNAARRL